MSQIIRYEVVQPPTSGEVEDAWFSAVKNRETIELEARMADVEVSAQAESEIFNLQIIDTKHRNPDSRDMRFIAKLVIDEIVTNDTAHVYLPEDTQIPARLDVVSGD